MIRLLALSAAALLPVATALSPDARPAPPASQPRPQILIVANPGVNAASASKLEVREIFTGERSRLRGGARVTPILLRSSVTTDTFLSGYLDRTDADFRTGWRSLVFSGQATMPRSLETEAEVVELIAHTAGTIGYISRTTPHDGVKVLASR